MNTTLAVQRALLARGYDPGPTDGIPGRKTTAAVAKFQAAEKLDVRYPGTVGPKTLAALGIAEVDAVEPVWITEARRHLGKHEVRDARELDRILRLDASEIAWCGAFVGMTIAAALPKEPLPANPLGSRNWLKFGRTIDAPQIGGIAVFYRGNPSGWQGHVTHIVGHDRTHIHGLGGNQSDKVSIARIAKSRLLGIRYPLTGGEPPIAPLPMTTIAASITTNEA